MKLLDLNKIQTKEDVIAIADDIESYIVSRLPSEYEDIQHGQYLSLRMLVSSITVDNVTRFLFLNSNLYLRFGINQYCEILYKK